MVSSVAINGGDISVYPFICICVSYILKTYDNSYKKTNKELYLIFALALVTAYLAMCAQFESWKHPLTIMLTVPMAILGGLLGLLVVGSSLNIYSQIALIILIGLSAKNGILIVEFANQIRKEGKNLEVAVLRQLLLD